MTKFFKKSLAVVVATALCLTAFVGCLTASAAESTGTIAIGSTEVAEGTATATIDVNLTSDGFLAMYTKISYPDTLKLTGVTSTNAGLTSNYEIAKKQEGATYTEGDLQLIIENNATGLADLTAASFTLTFDTSKTPVGTYAITYVKSDAANNAENTVVFTGTSGVLTVKASHTHVWSTDWSHDETNHWHVCTAAGCTDPVATSDLAAHTASDWIVDKAATTTEEGSRHKECTVCKYVMETETIPVVVVDALTTSLDTVTGTTKYALNVGFNFNFTGNVKTYGVLFYRAASYTDGMETTVDNADLTTTLTAASGKCTISGFNSAAITEKYVFVPYVISDTDVYYYGTPEKVSYVDYLLDRLANGSDTVKAKAKGILDLYYLTNATAAYEGQPAPTYPDFVSAGTYSAVTPMSVDNNGEFVATPSITGTTKHALNVGFDFSNYTGTAAEYGVLFYRAASYANGIQVSVDNADLKTTLGTSTAKCTISGFNFAATGERFVFVPYVKDNDGAYHYGNAAHISYTDYLISKLAVGQSATVSQKALAILDLYKVINGADLYTVQ